MNDLYLCVFETSFIPWPKFIARKLALLIFRVNFSRFLHLRKWNFRKSGTTTWAVPRKLMWFRWPKYNEMHSVQIPCDLFENILFREVLASHFLVIQLLTEVMNFSTSRDEKLMDEWREHLAKMKEKKWKKCPIKAGYYTWRLMVSWKLMLTCILRSGMPKTILVFELSKTVKLAVFFLISVSNVSAWNIKMNRFAYRTSNLKSLKKKIKKTFFKQIGYFVLKKYI